ncbi:hypothetical protein HPB48_011510 [Haemaphysalis longicornis]|uniref:Uncharacterized protein n=1 Tax=Haemaphysalis longicornis TaxID=44386 RepID=A0A9J6G565_HAELO|nr:hypothetical protein HPB48_011510 [Haemaphysalis longicornis]
MRIPALSSRVRAHIRAFHKIARRAASRNYGQRGNAINTLIKGQPRRTRATHARSNSGRPSFAAPVPPLSLHNPPRERHHRTSTLNFGETRSSAKDKMRGGIISSAGRKQKSSYIRDRRAAGEQVYVQQQGLVPASATLSVVRREGAVDHGTRGARPQSSCRSIGCTARSESTTNTDTTLFSAHGGYTTQKRRPLGPPGSQRRENDRRRGRTNAFRVRAAHGRACVVGAAANVTRLTPRRSPRLGADEGRPERGRCLGAGSRLGRGRLAARQPIGVRHGP